MATEFPAWRFRSGEAKIFNSAEDLAKAGSGWCDSPALVSQATEVAETVPAVPEAPEGFESGADYSGLDKAGLIELAEAEGIEVDGRWSRAKIIEKLEAAQKVSD